MEVWTTFHNVQVAESHYNLLLAEYAVGSLHVQDTDHLCEVFDEVKQDAVVNAVGIVKQRDKAKQSVPSISINTLFPYQLADLCVERGIWVIQISTHCVFSGFR